MSPDSDRRKRVLDLIANDASGLLETVTSKHKSHSTSTSVSGLQEILDFATEHGRLPTENLESVWEFQLATRFKSAKAIPELQQLLAKLDTKGILKG